MTVGLFLDSDYKAKYIALSEEMKSLRHKLLQEVEDEIESLTMQKRQAEKQVERSFFICDELAAYNHF